MSKQFLWQCLKRWFWKTTPQHRWDRPMTNRTVNSVAMQRYRKVIPSSSSWMIARDLGKHTTQHRHRIKKDTGIQGPNVIPGTQDSSFHWYVDSPISSNLNNSTTTIQFQLLVPRPVLLFCGKAYFASIVKIEELYWLTEYIGNMRTEHGVRSNEGTEASFAAKLC